MRPARTHRTIGPLLLAAVLTPFLMTYLVFGAPVSEYAVKAAFLFYFAKFVSWPNDVSAHGDVVEFAVYGSDPFGRALDETVAAQTIGGKKVAIRRISRLKESEGCRVLFISPAEDARLTVILDELRDSPILTVGESDGFTDRGGMIGFVHRGNKIRFSINLRAATAAHLKISSQLLDLAAEVVGP